MSVQHVLYSQATGVTGVQLTQHVLFRKCSFARLQSKTIVFNKIINLNDVNRKTWIFTNVDMCSFIMKSKNLSQHFCNYVKPFGPEQHFIIDKLDAISSDLLFLEWHVWFTPAPFKFLSRQGLLRYSQIHINNFQLSCGFILKRKWWKQREFSISIKKTTVYLIFLRELFLILIIFTWQQILFFRYHCNFLFEIAIFLLYL